MGEWLGKGLAMLVDVLNPEVIIAGTLGVVLGDLLLEPARRVMQCEALPLAANACRLAPAQLGSSLGDICSLMAAIDASRRGRLILALPDPQAQVEAMLRAGIEVRWRTIQILSGEIAASGQVLVEVLKKGGKVLVCGNGGSAATAQHLAGELAGRFKAERRPLPGLALTADSSVLTCIGNDYAFDEVFSRQVQALAGPQDMVIGITTSGRSKNVLRALQVASELGATTIALTGEAGLSGLVVNHLLAAPSSVTARVQEEHDAILHAWCEAIDRAFANID
jgi:D-sedoheptulose 7-phosphate isomerase